MEKFDVNNDNSAGRESRVTIRLLDLVRRTNYSLEQENGQRRLTAPELVDAVTAENSDGSGGSGAKIKEKAKGAEIFIGRLPRDCYEDELMPIFGRVGRLLELRLMLDFSGSTRGYAFALFQNCTTAREACKILDGYEIRPGHRIGVVMSIDNCRLFFGGVPKDKNKAFFLSELSKMLDGITDVYVYPNAEDRTKNRGFIFVEFKDHRSAAMARRKLIPGRVVLWNHEIAVDWADPEPGEPVDEEIMETVSALFVRNLSLDTPHQKIREIFQKSTGIPIIKLKKINHFAFVHYENRQMAQSVFDIVTQPGGIAERERWEIRWAKPINSSKMIERQRCINEAVTMATEPTTSNNARVREVPMSSRSKKSSQRNSHNKRRNEQSAGLVKEPTEHLKYKRILEDFVAKHLNASCRFEWHNVPGQSGHMCKVTIVSGNEILYEFCGNRYASKQTAIEDAARQMYEGVNLAIMNRVQTSVPYGDGWFIADDLLPAKIEACR